MRVLLSGAFYWDERRLHMLRIAICVRDEKISAALFDGGREVLHQRKIKCELSCHKDFAKVAENLAQDKSYYDIFFLDGTDEGCLALAKRLRGINLTASVVFCDRDLSRIHTLLRFRPSALLLPESLRERLGEVLGRCCDDQLRCRQHFIINNKDGMMRIPFEEITFVESRQRLAIMHTRSKTIEFYAKLSDVMQQLPQEDFIHCHQSYIVSLRKVTKLDKANRCFILNSGIPVEISKSNYSDVLARYSAFSGV